MDVKPPEKRSRRRRSSSLMYTEPPESLDHISDQAVIPNLNSEWVNAKGMIDHQASGLASWQVDLDKANIICQAHGQFILC